MDHPRRDVQQIILTSLSQQRYQITAATAPIVDKLLHKEGEEAVKLLAALADVGERASVMLLRDALTHQLRQRREVLFALLSFRFPSQIVLRARDSYFKGAESRSFALEVVDMTVGEALKTWLIPVLDDLTPSEALGRLTMLPQRRLDLPTRLCDLLASPEQPFNAWIKSCALHALAGLCNEGWELTKNLRGALERALNADDPLIRETAEWAVAQPSIRQLLAPRAATGSLEDNSTLQLGTHGRVTGESMLSTIEKVMILRTVALFEQTPDEILAKAAPALTLVDLALGQLLFSKGDLGRSMYIIIGGKVKIHDGERIFNYLGDHEVFGEMAVLSSEPRTASITAVEDTRLLRFDQRALHELMADYPEVMQGVLNVLASKLRDRIAEIDVLHAERADRR